MWIIIGNLPPFLRKTIWIIIIIIYFFVLELLLLLYSLSYYVYSCTYYHYASLYKNCQFVIIILYDVSLYNNCYYYIMLLCERIIINIIIIWCFLAHELSLLWWCFFSVLHGCRNGKCSYLDTLSLPNHEKVQQAGTKLSLEKKTLITNKCLFISRNG